MRVECERFENSIAAYIDQELPEVEVAAFETHSHSCDACGELFGALCEGNGPEPEPLDVDASNKLWQGITAALPGPSLEAPTKKAPAAVARPRSRSWLAALAVAAILLAGLAVWRLTRDQGKPEVPEQIAEVVEKDDSPAIVIEDIEVGENYMFSIHRPDGNPGEVTIIVCSLGD